MDNQIDANSVIQRLSNKLAEAYVTISILESQLESANKQQPEAPSAPVEE